MAFVSDSLATSALKALALPPASVISLAALSLSAVLRATTRTEQPTAPKRRAIPRPIPLLAPVMTAVRPASDLNIESSFLRFPPASSKFREIAHGHPKTILRLERSLPPQSLSASPFTAGAFGFSLLIHGGERPEMQGESRRFDIMP